MKEETIAAVVTAPGAASVGIIRLSGDEAIAIAQSVYQGKKDLTKVPSHTVHLGRVFDKKANRVIDEALFVVMRGPKSFTGEDVVEIQCHGGTVVLNEIMLLLLCQGARLAEAGEYSKRAFLNGKLDLAQAEAIMDIVSAKTEKSLDVALRQLSGGLSGKVKAIRADLLELIAYIQADIDYPDDDIERLSDAEFLRRVAMQKGAVEQALQTASKGEMLRDGIKTVIIGKPNVGKSSLLNVLLGRERAIVTDIPGTTRDAIEEYVSIGGVPLNIIDTAGIRETANQVERIGVDRAKAFLEAADLVLYVFEPKEGLTAEDETIIEQIGDKPVIFLQNKMDLDAAFAEASLALIGERPLVMISAKENQGIDRLQEAILRLFFQGDLDTASDIMVTNLRHRRILEETLAHLSSFIAGLSAGLSNDFLVIDLQSAWEKLGKITGETIEEDLLDQIFSKFCLGK